MAQTYKLIAALIALSMQHPCMASSNDVSSDDDSYDKLVARQPVTLHKYIKLDDIDYAQFGPNDLIIASTDNALIRNRNKKQDPGLFRFSKTVRQIRCQVLFLAFQHLWPEFSEGQQDMQLQCSLDKELLSQDLQHYKGGVLFENSLGSETGRIHPIPAIKAFLSRYFVRTGNLIFLTSCTSLIGEIEEADWELPVHVYFRLTPKHLKTSEFMKYALIGEDHLQWVFNEDAATIGARIRANPRMLLDRLYEPFAGRDGLKLYYALIRTKKHNALALAYAKEAADDSLFDQTVLLLRKRTNRGSQNNIVDESPHRLIYGAIKRLAKLYNPDIWADVLVATALVMHPGSNAGDCWRVIKSIVQLWKRDPALIPELTASDPLPARALLRRGMARNLVPELAQCLESPEFSGFSKYYLWVKLATALSPAKQYSMLAMLRGFMTMDAYRDKLNVLKTDDAFKTYPSFKNLWKVDFRFVYDQTDAADIPALLDAGLRLAQAEKRSWMQPYSKPPYFLGCLAGLKGPLIDIVTDKTIQFIEDEASGLRNYEGSGRHIDQLVSAFKSCADLWQADVLYLLLQGSARIYGQILDQNMVQVLGHMPHKNREIVARLFGQYIEFGCELGTVTPDSFYHALSQMSQLELRALEQIEDDFTQAVKSRRPGRVDFSIFYTPLTKVYPRMICKGPSKK